MPRPMARSMAASIQPSRINGHRTGTIGAATWSSWMGIWKTPCAKLSLTPHQPTHGALDGTTTTSPTTILPGRWMLPVKRLSNTELMMQLEMQNTSYAELDDDTLIARGRTGDLEAFRE